jgi:hypothetical protein
MGGSSQTQDINSSTSPWTPQAGALTTAFNDAGTALTKAQGATAPTNYAALFNPNQLDTFNQMLGYSNNNTLPSTLQTAGTANTNTGTSAINGALGGMSGFNASSTLGSPSVVNTANDYMKGYDIPSQVKQAMTAGVQTANEVTLPGLTQNANNTGNSDSSRAGIASGLVQQGLAEQGASLAGSLGSTAWNNSLTDAINSGQYQNTDTLNNLSNWGILGNNAGTLGLNQGTGSVNNATNIYTIGENAGAGQQAADQANLTNQYDQYLAGVNAPFTPLNNYMSVVGSNNWGNNTTGTTTTKSTPSAWSVIGGLLGAGGSLAGGLGGNGLGWKPLG